MRMDDAITTLVGEELEGTDKWRGTLAAPNGSIYGIPSCAGRVAKFNPGDYSMTEIGPDFGTDAWKWSKGAITDSGIIYCPPGNEDHGILKIDTNTDNVTELDRNLLPERGKFLWLSCAAALDGCIYFMPANARRIMKLDPNNNDAMTSVGDDLGDEEWKCIATVVGIDGCVYGIPFKSKRILKYDPINYIASFVGEEADYFRCCGNSVLARDGCIYALTEGFQILKIDTANNSHSFVGNRIQSDNHCRKGWFDAILGTDGCIYWPPMTAMRALKHDPHSNQTSLVGDTFESEGYMHRYIGGALATDGVIYCIPLDAKQVLAIDPLREFSVVTKTNMEEHPAELGFLFRINAKDNNPDTDTDTDTDTLSNQTNFDCAVTKFGMQKVLEIVQEHMPPVNEVCGLYPFMLAASYKESPLWIVYVLLRQVPSLINSNRNSTNNVHCSLKHKIP